MSDIIERLRSGKSVDSDLLWNVTPIHLEAADEIERLRKGIQNYLDGDYGRIEHFDTKHDQCPHKRFQWEGCENCIDDYFKKLLDPVTPAVRVPLDKTGGGA